MAIIGLGPTIGLALQAQSRLHATGISAAVLNARFVKPLDEALIAQYARRCGSLVVVEEHVSQGGLGSAVLEACSKLGLSPHTRLLGVPDRFIPHGSNSQLLKLCRIDVEDIVTAARGGGQEAQSGRRRPLAGGSGLMETRADRAAIMAGQVSLNGVKVDKAGFVRPSMPPLR